MPKEYRNINTYAKMHMLSFWAIYDDDDGDDDEILRLPGLLNLIFSDHND